ncbi:MAG: zinc finger domain-containing protein [Nitrososphaerota archaeon]
MLFRQSFIYTKPKGHGEVSLPAIRPPICSSCNRTINPRENAVKFYCPDCGKVLIWRCERCRKLARPYKCENCGFEGP